MAKLTFQRFGTWPSCRRTRIQSLEALIGSLLPADYRNFLLQHNGGIPSKRCFANAAGGESPWVTQFLCLDEHLKHPSPKAHPSSIAAMQRAFGEIVPKSCLIIGMVVSVDLLLLRFAGKTAGRIFLKGTYEWSASLDNTAWSRYREKGNRRVADSFTDFLASLRDCS